MKKGIDYSKLKYGTKQYFECTVNIYLDNSVSEKETDKRIEQFYRTKYNL